MHINKQYTNCCCREKKVTSPVETVAIFFQKFLVGSKERIVFNCLVATN